jgi:hypothetical protein
VVWAGTPFYTMTFLAGLQAIPKELYEAAEIDGASIVQQFFYVTIPRLRTIFLTTVMLSTIWTATNLQFVYILTKGGPAGRTEIFPHSVLHDGARGLPPRDGRRRLPRFLPRPGSAHLLPHAPHAAANATIGSDADQVRHAAPAPLDRQRPPRRHADLDARALLLDGRPPR